jgi:hypothetical protein
VLASEGFFISKNILEEIGFFSFFGEMLGFVSSLLSLQFLKSPLKKTPALQLMVCDIVLACSRFCDNW